MLGLALSLAALAGWVDATGFIYFKGLFLSFMSGNSTKAAVSLIQGNLPKAVELGRTIALFVFGTAAGELLAAAGGRHGRLVVLGCESLCLGCAAFAAADRFDDTAVASLLAFVMGLQNAVLHKVGETSVGLTYVTGTLVQVGRGIAGIVRGTVCWRIFLSEAGLWIALTCGGLAGAVAAGKSFAVSLAGATAICVTILVWAFSRRSVLAAAPR